MSVSPPVRRYSSTSSSREDLINQYEAEEERIINVLSRKLERLREEKIALENTLEAESENHVNRLSREISALRLAQQQQQGQANGSGSGSPVETRIGLHTFLAYRNPVEPTPEMMLEAMRRENEQLRSRLVDTERDYIRVTRLNEIYREELIEHRRRLGLPVDNLIGLSTVDPYAQPTHRRSSSVTSSPTASILASPIPQRQPSVASRPIPGVPIPRPPSQVHRPTNISSESTTPLSHSPSSPFMLSPSSVSPLPGSYATAVTTPPSSASLALNGVAAFAGAPPPLSYPSVPPPSLSSSFGSPQGESFVGHNGSYPRHGSLERRVAASGSLRSPSRGPGERRVVERGILRSPSRGTGHSRRASVEQGARVAETGTLLPRGRARREGLQTTPEGEGLTGTMEGVDDNKIDKDDSGQHGSS